MTNVPALALAPVLIDTGTGASTRTLDSELLDRAARPDYHQWLAGTAAAGGCVRPVRLRGTIRDINPATGEILRTLDTETLPDRAIYTPCGDRRASVCPACAETYRRDTYQLIRAGLTGGKGIPETVASHPCVFATFTAPSFGPVHTRRPQPGGRPPAADPAAKPPPARTDGGCPAASATKTPTPAWDGRCARTATTTQRPWCGTSTPPSCGGAPPSPSAASSPRPPARTASARCSCPTPRWPSSRPAASSTSTPSSASTPPAPRETAPARPHRRRPDRRDPQAAASVWFATVAHPARPRGWDIRWGRQLDTRTIRLPAAANGQLPNVAVASYLAKYATKTTEAVGTISSRITAANVSYYGNPASHRGRLIRAAWHLGSHQHPDFAALRRWAHMLGYRGHFATKSRRYSTTLRALRQARADYRRRHNPIAASGEHGDRVTITITRLEWAGRGWRTTGDALLALSAAARTRDHERAARDEAQAA